MCMLGQRPFEGQAFFSAFRKAKLYGLIEQLSQKTYSMLEDFEILN